MGGVITRYVRGLKVGKLKTLDDATFQGALDTAKPLLVDFGASWCGPCWLLEPVLEELAEEYGAQVKVMKADFDASHRTATELGVRSLPTVVFFKNGREVDRLVGALPKAALAEHIDALLEVQPV
jgi:thioredoxin 1